MGRKTLLTPELITQICNRIKSGDYDHVAAEACGIGQSTFYLWLQQAEKPNADPLKVEFASCVEQARVEARAFFDQTLLCEVDENNLDADKPEAWLFQNVKRTVKSWAGVKSASKRQKRLSKML